MSETRENTAAADEAIRRADGPPVPHRESGNPEPGVVLTADPFEEKRTITLSRWQRDAIRCPIATIRELPEEEDPQASFELAGDLDEIVAIWDRSSS